MEYYVPGEIYKNLLQLMVRIGGNITGEVYNEADLQKKLNSQQYVSIVGSRKNDVRGDATLVIIYTTENSKFSSKTANIKKLISDVVDVAGTELHMVTHSPIKARILDGLELPHSAKLYNYSSNIFLTDPNTSVHVPKHTIADSNEVSDFCHQFYLQPDKFPKLLSTDPQAIWIGAKPGMVVKVERTSISAGGSTIYRYVV